MDEFVLMYLGTMLIAAFVIVQGFLRKNKFIGGVLLVGLAIGMIVAGQVELITTTRITDANNSNELVSYHQQTRTMGQEAAYTLTAPFAFIVLGAGMVSIVAGIRRAMS